MSDQMNPPPPAVNPSAGGPQSVKGMATASMVLGIIGVVFVLFCMPLSVILALIGLPLGAISYSRQNKGTAANDSKGMAIAGMVLNGISLALAVVLFLFVGVAMMSNIVMM